MSNRIDTDHKDSMDRWTYLALPEMKAPKSDWTWQDNAMCRTEDFKDLDFFALRSPTNVAACKRACTLCVVRPECLQFAQDNELPGGIWGGLMESEREGLKS